MLIDKNEVGELCRTRRRLLVFWASAADAVRHARNSVIAPSTYGVDDMRRKDHIGRVKFAT